MKNSWLFKHIVLLCSFLTLGCSERLYTYFAGQQDLKSVSGNQAVPRTKLALKNRYCQDYQAYVPDTSRLDHFPIKYIRINFHWMNALDSASNFYGEVAERFVEGLLVSANKDLKENFKMWLPPRNNTPVLPTRYQYVLAAQSGIPGDKGIYFHFDDETCYYVHKGKNRNISDRRVIERYGVGADSILNIFIMPHHPDSVASPTYLANGVGVSLGSFIKMSGPFEQKGPPWQFRGILNHEVGHVFGLDHTWAFNDGCDDTPQHPNNCWSKTEIPPCDTMASNNVMDYSALQIAWTPCQIGKIQMRMADLQHRTRRFLLPLWCYFDPSKTIAISDSLTWEGSKDLEGNLVIEEGGFLELKCRLSLPPDGKITVLPGGTLYLNGAFLHNACGKPWQGIELGKSGKKTGVILYQGDFKIENAKNHIFSN